MLPVGVFYVAGITMATMFAFGWDKICAVNGWRRVPENTLLILALAGGTVGAIAGQQIMRHKTRKQPFRTYLYTIAGLQILALAALSLQSVREAAEIAIRQLAG